MKLILTILLTLVIISNIHCQTLTNFGIKIGLGISNLSYEIQDEFNLDLDSKFSYSPRIFADFGDFSFFTIVGEIGFSRKGFEKKLMPSSSPEGAGESISTSTSLYYLSLAALPKFKYKLMSITSYLIVGPQLNYLLNQNTSDEWGEIINDFNKVNIGLSVGAGCEINNTFSVPIILEYRFERDFFNNSNSLNINTKNYTHLFFVGVKI